RLRRKIFHPPGQDCNHTLAGSTKRGNKSNQRQAGGPVMGQLRMLRSGAITACILICTLAASAQHLPKRKAIRPQDVHVFSTNLVTVPSASPLYEIQIMARTGSADDPAGKEGTAKIEAGFGDPKNPTTTQKLAEITRPWGSAAFPTVLVDKETTTFSMAVPRENFDEFVARVLKPILNQPLWVAPEVERLRRESLTDIQSSLRFEDEESLGLLTLDNYVFSGT